MILLTAGMTIVGAGLLQTREDSPDILPEATATADSGDLLMSSDLAPDPAKWFLPYDGDLTDADGNPVRLSALRGKTTILLFWSSWCPDCQVYLAGDFGAAVQAAQAAGAQVVLVCREGIRGDTREKAEAELTECGITGIPLYMDADAALFHTLGLRSVPSLAVSIRRGSCFAQRRICRMRMKWRRCWTRHSIQHSRRSRFEPADSGRWGDSIHLYAVRRRGSSGRYCTFRDDGADHALCGANGGCDALLRCLALCP